MHYILMLALFFTCLSAASATDDPVTKRNNDARTPVLIKSLFAPQQLQRPSRPVVKPDQPPKDSEPTK